jgi:hypothetical protein
MPLFFHRAITGPTTLQLAKKKRKKLIDLEILQSKEMCSPDRPFLVFPTGTGIGDFDLTRL